VIRKTRLEPPLAGRLILRLRRLGGRRAEVDGDLRELFDERVRTRGRWYARLRYVLDALSLWRWRVGAFVTAERTVRHVRPDRLLANSVLQDVTFAIRMFARQPGIVLMTMAGLSLAIGVSTVILTIVSAVTLRGSGIREPQELSSVEVFNLDRGRLVGGSPMPGNWAYLDFMRVRDVSSMDLAADRHATSPIELRQSADRSLSEAVELMAVSGNYFSLLGARARLGRTLLPADDVAGADRVAFVSHTLWKIRFDSDAAILGRTLWLDDVPFTVVGVAEPRFVGAHGSKFQTAPAVWITFSSQAAVWTEGLRAANASSPDRWNVPVDVVGRLRPNVSAVRAETELTAMARAFATERGHSGEHLAAVRLGPPDRPRTDPASTAIVAAIVMVLLALACSNVANLLLANATSRQREIGTRLALGAGRGRVIRQLLTESVLIGVCAGAVGLLLSRWLTPLVARLLPLPDLVDLQPDFGVYATAAGITLAAGLIAGLAPARYGLRGNLLTALQSDRAGSSGVAPPARLRSVLIGGQAAACVVLLVLAALLTRSAVEASRFDTGVAIDRLLNVSPNLDRDYDAARKAVYFSAALDRVKRLPGVVNAALATEPPFHTFQARMTLPGDSTTGVPVEVQRNDVSPDYFEAVGIRVLQGRTFSDDEVRRQLPVAIISASLAQQFWGDASPIGELLDRVWGPPDKKGEGAGYLGRKPPGTRVVGIVTDSMTQIDDHGLPTIYLPIDVGRAVVHLVVAAREAPRALQSDLRRELLALDPDLRSYTLLPGDKLRDGLQASRALAGITGAVGASALTLAVIGLFGVTAFVVGQRRREISIRIALGATGRNVVRMLVGDSLRPVILGVAVGLVFAFIGGQLMQSVLLGVSGRDPVAILSAVAILLGTASLAALVPARQAAGIDPAVTLKQE
jgi:predicted permease